MRMTPDYVMKAVNHLIRICIFHQRGIRDGLTGTTISVWTDQCADVAGMVSEQQAVVRWYCSVMEKNFSVSSDRCY